MIIDTKPFPGSISKSVLGLPAVYYEPKEIVRFGKTLVLEPSINDIIKSAFIANDKERYGYYCGLKSLNNMHGTTQIPVVIDIKSAKVDVVQKYKYGATIYIIHPSEKIITKDNYVYLEILDDIEYMYNYFEEDIVSCIKYLVKRLELSKQKFEQLLEDYSHRTVEVIDSVFA